MSLSVRLKRLKAEAHAKADRWTGVELWSVDRERAGVWRCDIASPDETVGRRATEVELARRLLRIPPGSRSFVLLVEGWPTRHEGAIAHARRVLSRAAA